MAINKISQKIFAQSILNMKQANFSALLSQPLNWQLLSKTYKDRFLTMHLWLNDSSRIEKLKNYPLPVQMSNNQQQQQHQVENKYSLYNANVSQMMDMDKKKRQILTQNQTDRLKIFFCKDPYPNSEKIDLIARELDIDAKKVANWFSHQRQQNRLFNKHSLK